MIPYEEACNYISEIPKFAPKTGLDNTRKLLEQLGRPDRQYKTIHIAGTNGKGSVAKMTALMLERAGYKTGLFISPHLVRMNERISVNGADVGDEEFAGLFAEVKKAVDELLKGNETPGENTFAHPAYFEFLYAMATLYYAKQGCDYVVLETGLGGRLDATNTTEPEICIITSIGMDHMQYLGNTIEAIAGEKAGIIMPGVPVVYNTGKVPADAGLSPVNSGLSPVNGGLSPADAVIERTAKDKNSPAYSAVELFRGMPDEIKDIVEEFAKTATAAYQKENAVTAVAALSLILGEREDYAELVKAALSGFFWPGRMEMIAPGVILDGAHNEDAIWRFVQSIRCILEQGPWKKLSLVFAVSEDKDYESIIRILCENLQLEDVYVGELNSSRRTDAAKVVELFQKYRPAGEYWDNCGFDNLKSAWNLALREKEEETLLAAVGSLYMVGEIKQFADTPKI